MHAVAQRYDTCTPVLGWSGNYGAVVLRLAVHAALDKPIVVYLR
jgi:hypothetical protein